MKKFPRYLLVSFILAVIAFILDSTKDVTLCIFFGCLFGLISLCFDTKEGRERKRVEAQRYKEEQERQERQRKAEEEARNAPGCYSMDGVDVMTFNSRNNILTSGNNWLSFKIRNRNAYGVIVSVRYKYSDGWERSTHSFEVAGNQIRTINTSGDAWRKAKDITIVAVH